MNKKIIDVNELKNSIEKLSETLPSLNIDSIYVEENGNVDKIIYNYDKLHELRSCAKVFNITLGSN